MSNKKSQEEAQKEMEELTKIELQKLAETISKNPELLKPKFMDSDSETDSDCESDSLEYINNNQDSLIISLYQSFMSSKEKLLTANNEFKATVNKMAPFKKKFFDSLFKKTIYFDNYKKTKQTISNPEKINIIKEITELKVEFIKFVFELADTINKIYELQRAYFISLKLLLEELKTQYVNIIKYYETPSLALECIQFDINNAAIFIDEDPENVYSRSYFAGLRKFKAFYEDKLYTNQQQLLNPQITLLNMP